MLSSLTQSQQVAVKVWWKQAQCIIIIIIISWTASIVQCSAWHWISNGYRSRDQHQAHYDFGSWRKYTYSV